MTILFWVFFPILALNLLFVDLKSCVLEIPCFYFALHMVGAHKLFVEWTSEYMFRWMNEWMNGFESRFSDLETFFQITSKCIVFTWLPYSFTYINNHFPSLYIPPGIMILWGTAYMKYRLTYSPVPRACRRVQVMVNTVSMLLRSKLLNSPRPSF